MNIKVKLDEGAFLPTRSHPTDAGLDLKAPYPTVVYPNSSQVINTGVHMELPHGTYGKVEGRSGLNIKKSVVTLGGVIDEGFTGSIAVKLYNFGNVPFKIEIGDRVAQLVIMPCLYLLPEEVEELANDLPRGNKGYGSTGR